MQATPEGYTLATDRTHSDGQVTLVQTLRDDCAQGAAARQPAKAGGAPGPASAHGPTDTHPAQAGECGGPVCGALINGEQARPGAWPHRSSPVFGGFRRLYMAPVPYLRPAGRGISRGGREGRSHGDSTPRLQVDSCRPGLQLERPGGLRTGRTRTVR